MSIEERKNELLTTTSPQELDGFNGFDDRIAYEDDDHAPASGGGGALRGCKIIKFSNEGTWVLKDGGKLPSELIANDVSRVVQKWVNDKPEETIVLLPGQKFPDVDAMNDKEPKSSWRDKFGKLVGPWQAQNILFFVDPLTLDQYCYPCPLETIGGTIAISELIRKIRWMRKYYKCETIHPVVVLQDTFMGTKWGGRQRPHFHTPRWIGVPGDGNAAPSAALAPPTAPALEGMREVPVPTLKQELNDDLPDYLK